MRFTTEHDLCSIGDHGGRPQECRTCHMSMVLQLGIYLTPWPSGVSRFSATMSLHSSAVNLVKPHIFEMWIFWWPGSLNLALHIASITYFLFYGLVQMNMMTWPMCPGAAQKAYTYLHGACLAQHRTSC